MVKAELSKPDCQIQRYNAGRSKPDGQSRMVKARWSKPDGQRPRAKAGRSKPNDQSQAVKARWSKKCGQSRMVKAGGPAREKRQGRGWGGSRGAAGTRVTAPVAPVQGRYEEARGGEKAREGDRGGRGAADAGAGRPRLKPTQGLPGCGRLEA